MLGRTKIYNLKRSDVDRGVRRSQTNSLYLSLLLWYLSVSCKWLSSADHHVSQWSPPTWRCDSEQQSCTGEYKQLPWWKHRCDRGVIIILRNCQILLKQNQLAYRYCKKMKRSIKIWITIPISLLWANQHNWALNIRNFCDTYTIWNAAIFEQISIISINTKSFRIWLRRNQVKKKK